MKVKQLIELLQSFDPDATIDMASDEEGNTFGDISPTFAKGKLKDKKAVNKTVYSLYPESQQLPEERYLLD